MRLPRLLPGILELRLLCEIRERELELQRDGSLHHLANGGHLLLRDPRLLACRLELLLARLLSAQKLELCGGRRGCHLADSLGLRRGRVPRALQALPLRLKPAIRRHERLACCLLCQNRTCRPVCRFQRVSLPDLPRGIERGVFALKPAVDLEHLANPGLGSQGPLLQGSHPRRNLGRLLEDDVAALVLRLNERLDELVVLGTGGYGHTTRTWGPGHHEQTVQSIVDWHWAGRRDEAAPTSVPGRVDSVADRSHRTTEPSIHRCYRLRL